jgi:paraquat-inducible protein B
MSRRANPVAVGAFVLGGVAIALVAIASLAAGNLFEQRIPFVLQFDGSINGLPLGAPVKFKGVEIGNVTRIGLPLPGTEPELPIRVYIVLAGKRLEDVGGLERFASPEGLEDVIRRGLRAQLESESFVTGVRYVALKMEPYTAARIHDPIAGYPEIPTLPSEFDLAQSNASQIIARLGALDFEELYDRILAAVRSIVDLGQSSQLRAAMASVDVAGTELARLSATLEREIPPLALSLRNVSDRAQPLQEELERTLAAARGTLESIRALAESLDRRTQPLLANLTAASQRLEKLQNELGSAAVAARDLLDPSAPLSTDLARALDELTAMAHSVRRFLEALEHNPTMLLRGRAEPDDR